MKSILSSLAILLCYTSVFSQSTERIVIKAGQDIHDVYKEVYRYPKFTYGKVYLLNGDSLGGKLNYNFFVEAMQFISPKGDTLSIDNEHNIKHIIIEKDTFYYDQGYLELLENYNFSKLAFKQRIRFADRKKIGAFGTASNALRIESEETFLGDRRYGLTIAEDIIFVKETEFYLKDSNNNFYSVNKKNLLKNFSEKKENIETYLKKNNINFREEKDLKKLAQYLQKLNEVS